MLERQLGEDLFFQGDAGVLLQEAFEVDGEEDVGAALEKGDLKFSLNGDKLKGSWVLVRTRGYGGTSKPSCLLIKHRDQYASTDDLLAKKPRSVSSNRLMADIARHSGGDVAKAAKADPPSTARSRAS